MHAGAVERPLPKWRASCLDTNLQGKPTRLNKQCQMACPHLDMAFRVGASYGWCSNSVEGCQRRAGAWEFFAAIIFVIGPRALSSRARKEKRWQWKQCPRCISRIPGLASYDVRSVHGRISRCAGVPCAESELIQTRTLAASAANSLRSFQIAKLSGVSSNRTLFVSPGAIAIV